MTKREIWASGQKKKSNQRDNRCIKNWPLSLLIRIFIGARQGETMSAYVLAFALEILFFST